ncbi:MAG: AraC family transcriptional regulator [Chromatiaceae bacterium]
MRAGPLVGIPRLLRNLGRDPTAVFAAAGCDPHMLDDPENAVSFTVVGRLLDTCVESTGCPHFGLLVGQQNGIECLGLVGMLAQHSPTLKHALRNIVLHLCLHDRGAVPTLLVANGAAKLGYAIYQPGVPAAAQIYCLSAAVGYNILHTLCGPSWRPRSVLLPHAKPEDLAPYRRVFGVTPTFDAEQMALVFAADWLGRQLPGAEPDLYPVLRERVAQLSATSYGDLPSQVRRVACSLLQCGNGSLESAANALSMHPRTLNRRLRRLGTTYRQLREECHQALACQLLLETELPIAEIAARLHYANAPAFTRAFQRWSGSTPAAWRTARRKG